MVSKWCPSGVHVVSKWRPSRAQVVSKWCPVESKWCPGIQVVSRWCPSGVQMVSRRRGAPLWCPSGIQAVSKWRPSGIHTASLHKNMSESSVGGCYIQGSTFLTLQGSHEDAGNLFCNLAGAPRMRPLPTATARELECVASVGVCPGQHTALEQECVYRVGRGCRGRGRGG